MPWAVYVTPAVFDRLSAGRDAHWQAELIVHELVHLQQYRAAGPMRHIARYGSDYVSGRRRGLSHWNAYLQVGAESDARRIAAEFRTSGEPR